MGKTVTLITTGLFMAIVMDGMLLWTTTTTERGGRELCSDNQSNHFNNVTSETKGGG
eukprot:m.12021 g.12021  ORF g.12021 m.12021 type:complete len:57 (-) comp9106_c0_seq1:386-556(-)